MPNKPALEDLQNGEVRRRRETSRWDVFLVREGQLLRRESRGAQRVLSLATDWGSVKRDGSRAEALPLFDCWTHGEAEAQEGKVGHRCITMTR
jgi:hypothetical protein